MKRVLVLALLATVVMSGCGIGGTANKNATGPKFEPTATTIPYAWPPHISAVSADVTRSQAISALQADFPTGWTETNTNATTQPNDAAIDEAFVQCMFGTQPSTLTSYAVSPLISSADGTSIAQSFVRSVISTDNARTDFANFKPARVSSCETAMYTRQFSLPAGTTIIGKKFGFAPPDSIPADTLVPPDGSNDVIGIRFYVAPRDAPQIYEDVFAYGVGRFEVVELFQGSNGNPDSNTEATALQAIKARALTQGHGV